MPRTPVPAADRIITRFTRSHRNDWSIENIDNATAVLNRVHAFLAQRDATLLHDDPDELVEHLEDYIEERRATPSERTGKLRAASSLLVEHRQIAAFYKWATTDQGDGDRLLRRNPVKRMTAPQVDPPDPTLMPVAERWQFDALMTTCRRATSDGGLRRRDGAIIAVLWCTGVRRSEVASMDFERLDFDTERIYLPRTKGGRRAPKSRYVTLVEEAMEAVDLWVDVRGRHDGPLFTSQRGGRLDPDSITLMLRRRGAQAAAALGLAEPVYMPAHGYRRSSAIDWLDNGGSESTLMTNHGWRTRKMIDVYTGAKATELAAAEARRVGAARRSGRLRSVS